MFKIIRFTVSVTAVAITSSVQRKKEIWINDFKQHNYQLFTRENEVWIPEQNTRGTVEVPTSYRIITKESF